VKKYIWLLTIFVSLVVLAARHHRHFTENDITRPHTQEWANMVIRTELNHRIHMFNRGDLIYLVHDRKVTVMKFMLNSAFVPVTLGLGEEQLRQEAARMNRGESTSHAHNSSTRGDHEDFLRELERLEAREDRRYRFLRGRVNPDCDGTTQGCDR